MTTLRRFQRGFSACGVGCFGLLILFAAIWSSYYSSIGKYRPVILPLQPLPTPNAFDDYVAAGLMYKANGGSRPLYSAESDLELLYQYADASGDFYIVPPADAFLLPIKQRIVGQNNAALALLRKAFGKACGIPANRGPNARGMHFTDLKGLGGLLRHEAEVHAAAGEAGGAWDIGVDAIQLGQDLARGSSYNSVSAGYLIQSRPQIWMAHSLDRVTLVACDRLILRMQRLLLAQPPLRENIAEERNEDLSAVMTLDGPFNNFPSEGTDMGFGMTAERQEVTGRSISRAIWHLHRDQALKQMESTFDAAMKEADKPAIQRSTIPSPTDDYANDFSGFLTNWLEASDIAQARTRLLLCGLAIRRYLLINGHLPEDLDQVRIDSRLLIDPFTGSRFVYRPIKEDYLLYSVGPDFKDDGGLPLWNDNFMDTTGDIGMISCVLEKKYGRNFERYLPVPHMKPPVQPPAHKL